MLAAVKAWPGESRVWENAERRPALTGVCARRHPRRPGRDEETACGQTKKLSGTERAAGEVFRTRRLIDQAGFGRAVHGVPRATTVLAKMSSFLAQAMSARLCSFPAALRR